MRFLHLIASNLKRKKVRTALTIASILIAFVLYGYLAAIKTALDLGVSVVGADRLVVRHKVSIIQLLPASYEARMEELEGVVEATPATWFGGVYQDPTNFFGQFPVDPDEYMGMYPEFLLPEEQMQAWRENRIGAIAGRALADRFGWEVGDRIPIQGTIWPMRDGSRSWEFDLVGIYDGAERATDTSQFLFRRDYFDEARPEQTRGLVGWYVVRVDDPDQAGEIALTINEEFANSPAEVSAETELAFVQGFANQIGNIGAIIVAVLSAVFFTILLVAGNTMGQAVRERRNEIGVLKALGFSHGQMLGVVLAESCFLSMLGGLGGLGLAVLLISAGDPTGGAFPNFFFPPANIAIGVVLTVALGMVAGALPALAAMRLRAVDALRRK